MNERDRTEMMEGEEGPGERNGTELMEGEEGSGEKTETHRLLEEFW